MSINVSIIVPAYNSAPYIQQAVESALRQTMNDLEVIVIDDASTDRTAEILRTMHDPRLKIFVNDRNLGVSYARNRAIQIARGRWIAVLDADDWYAPDRLASLLAVADFHAADIIADDVFFVEDGQSTPWSTLITESGEVIDRPLTVSPVRFVESDRYGQQCLHLGLTKPMFRRDFLEAHHIRYDATMSKREDYWFLLECLVFGARFVLAPTPYYFYRSRTGSLIHAHVVGTLESFCEKTIAFLNEKELERSDPDLALALQNNLQEFRHHLAYQKIIQPLKSGQYGEAITQLTRNPRALQTILAKLPDILKRRLQFYITGDKTIFTRHHLRGRN